MQQAALIAIAEHSHMSIADRTENNSAELSRAVAGTCDLHNLARSCHAEPQHLQRDSENWQPHHVRSDGKQIPCAPDTTSDDVLKRTWRRSSAAGEAGLPWQPM